MSRRTIRSLLIPLILLVGGVGLLFARPELLPFARTSAANAWVIDIDTWRRTPHERVVTSPFDFSLTANLSDLPLRIDEWSGVDVPQTNIEVFILLEPEQYVQRRYMLPDGRYVWLSLIGSRKARSFHPTEICYISDGWQTNVNTVDVPLRRGSIRALKVYATKGEWTHVVLYFYVWPNEARDMSQGVVMFKVTAPIWDTEEATLELERQFIREFFYEVQR